jgi:hypothetical protein
MLLDYSGTGHGASGSNSAYRLDNRVLRNHQSYVSEHKYTAHEDNQELATGYIKCIRLSVSITLDRKTSCQALALGSLREIDALLRISGAYSHGTTAPQLSLNRLY